MDEHLYEFDEFRVDPVKRTLTLAGARVPLTPKVFDVLLLLVRRDGEVVPRDELIAAVWPDSFVEESNLTQTIFMLRKALGRDLVVTIPGQGYRLSARVRSIAHEGRPATTPVEPLPSRRRTWLVTAAAVALVTIVTLVASFRPSGNGRAVSHPGGRMMLAVLPFQNLTGDPAQEYFSDGLTEEMITQIGKLDPRYLGVIARTSVMHYKSATIPLNQIAGELGVQYILEGSVRRDAEKVRVTAKLVSVADQSPSWAREYDRKLNELLALERDIAHDIAEEIQLTIEEERGTAAGMTPRQFEAYDAYLKGRYYWNRRTIADFRNAVEHFERSIAADAGQARAYAGLADCYLLMPGYAMEPQAPYVAKAREATRKALELNESLAEAHTSLALLMANHDWNWNGSEREYRRAIELDPNYATAHHWYAEMLMWTGRFDDALHESERARQLDPLSLIIAADNGVILHYARRYALAEKQLSAVLELEPRFPRAHMIRFVYTEQGDFEKALSDIAKFSPDDTPWDRAYVLGRAGRREEARRALDAFAAYSETHRVDPGARALAFAGSRDIEEALRWLERAFAERSMIMTSINVDPAWDPLRGDPRFQRLLTRVGFDTGPARRLQ